MRTHDPKSNSVQAAALMLCIDPILLAQILNDYYKLSATTIKNHIK